MKNCIILLFSVFVLLLLLSDCSGRSRHRTRSTQVEYANSRRHNKSRSRNSIVIPHQPDNKKDTIIMIVPMQPDNDIVQRNDGDIIIPSSKVLKPVKHSANLPTPPSIVFSKPFITRSREEYIEYFDLESPLKDLIISCDYDNPTVRNNAAALVSISPGSFNLGQICDIFDFCYQNWSYVNDPITLDYFAKASETIKNGMNGDCDDFAILICSMIISIGGEARINFAYTDGSGHAFTEVNIGTTNRDDVINYLKTRYGRAELWHKEEGDVWWLNLDWQGRYPGAKYWDYDYGKCFNILRNTYVDF